VKPPLGAGSAVGVVGGRAIGLGSGKFGTPCERMHLANASMLGLVGVLGTPVVVVDAGAVLCATVGAVV
jgi:hypothetical protein